MRYVTSLSLALMLIVSTWAAGSTLESGTVATTLVPRTIEYNVLLPDGYSADGDRYPLILALAGGPGDSSLLKQYQKSFDRLWQTDELPKLVVVMPSVRPFSSYTDFRDGSEKWESAVLGPFLEHVRVRYHVTSDHRKTVLIGHSMGGHGGLQMAMRHPEKLGAVVAAAPGIPPAIKWEEVELRNRSFLSEGHWKVLYGDPIDPDYWEQCNPASIVTRDPERIRESGIKIYLACGDEDSLISYKGVEFFHRLLMDHGIRHEYHLIYGLDHEWSEPAIEDALRFVSRVLRSELGNPWYRLFLREVLARGGFPGLADSDEGNKRFNEEVWKTLVLRFLKPI